MKNSRKWVVVTGIFSAISVTLASVIAGILHGERVREKSYLELN